MAFLIPSPFIVWLQSVVESTMVEAGAKLDNLSHEFIYIFHKNPKLKPAKNKSKILRKTKTRFADLAGMQ